MIVAFLLLQFCFSVFADVPPCENGVVVFNCPMTSSNITSYPYDFTNDNLTTLPNNYECEYQFIVPQGWYSQVSLVLNSIPANSGDPAPVVVTDQLQISEEVFSSNYDPFFFVANGGKIKLSTRNSKIQFGFVLNWGQYIGYPRSVNVSKSDTQPFLYNEIFSRPYQIRADTQVSVTMMPPSKYMEPYIRGVMFFDGSNWNSTSIGNGMQLWKSKSQFVSSGNSMTIRFLGNNWVYTYIKLLIQDYEHTKNFTRFQGINCDSLGSCNNIVLDGSSEPLVVQSFYAINDYSPEVLTKLEGTGTLDVYIGTITADKSNLVASYNAAHQNGMSFPQAFFGKFQTFVVTGGKVTLSIIRDPYLFDYTTSFGRTGFIASNQYGSNSTLQYTNRQIESVNRTTIAKFKFNIKTADLVGPVTMNITGWTDNKQVFLRHYDASHLPTLNLYSEFYAQKLSVVYDNQQQLNNGFYMEFEVDNGSFKVFNWIAVVFVFIRA